MKLDQIKIGAAIGINQFNLSEASANISKLWVNQMDHTMVIIIIINCISLVLDLVLQ
jgi:hypothetical protein